MIISGQAGACSSAGRALPLQGRGPGFESQQVHLDAPIEDDSGREGLRPYEAYEAVYKLCDQTLTEFSGAFKSLQKCQPADGSAQALMKDVPSCDKPRRGAWNL